MAFVAFLILSRKSAPSQKQYISGKYFFYMFYSGEFDREDEDPEYKPTRTPFKDEIDVRTSNFL